MAKSKLEREIHSIVAVGSFNPKIFHPVWFLKNSLISDEDADKAEVSIVNSDFSIFRIDALSFQITNDRLIVSTPKEPYFDFMKGLILSTFKILRHTPVDMLGINLDSYYSLRTVEDLNNLGHKLVPKDQIWSKFLTAPGLKSVTVQDNNVIEGKGQPKITIEPVVDFSNGMVIKVNDHYLLKKDSGDIGAESFIKTLSENWESSLKKSRSIINYL